MAPPYSNGYHPPSSSTSHSNMNNNNINDLPLHNLPLSSEPTLEDVGLLLRNAIRVTSAFVDQQVARITGAATSDRNGPRGRRQRMPVLVMLADACVRHLRVNLMPRRLFSVPHLLVAFWVVVLLWGEQWVFHASVSSCQWDHWEKWPSGATPHHLVFVADPQIIDAHSYPGRPWPLSSITYTLTDNYMRRSYRELQEQLRPDTVFFLGDLFDGGREWRTLSDDFQDPAWSTRPEHEKAYARQWRKHYGNNYWMREYNRFGDLFFDPFNQGGNEAGSGQRGRRLIASLPGNHDLGFGSEVKLSARKRFESFFGDTNRVDVIGNHTFVSVDTVSLSAYSSDQASQVQPIYAPVQQFLDNVAWTKQKAVARELRFQQGLPEEVPFAHKIEDVEKADFDLESLKGKLGGGNSQGAPQADLPTILLTHVPLYRPPGTPCGPKREHWPPSKPNADGTPVVPDDRNAISVSRGYQYQNVLSEPDSINLVKKIGNVIHAFSGDDHDYCEVVHDEQQDKVPEITVKSFSMAMGVPTPGFLMLSMYNPIDEAGNPLPQSQTKDGKPAPPTIQTHLCLLPNQLGTYARYVGMIAVSLVLLAARAVLVPVLGLQPFAIGPDDLASAGMSPSTLLPLYNSNTKAKVEDDEYGKTSGNGGGGGGGGGIGLSTLSSSGGGDMSSSNGTTEKRGTSGSSGFFAFQSPATYSRGRSMSNGRWGTDMAPNDQFIGQSVTGGGSGSGSGSNSNSNSNNNNNRNYYYHQNQSQHQHRQHKNRKGGRSGLGGSPANLYDLSTRSGPKIQISRDDYDDDDDDSYDDERLDDDDYLGSGGSSYYYGGAGGGRRSTDRWRPAARRGAFGMSLAALTTAKKFIMGVLGMRGGRRGGQRRAGSRRRRAGASSGRILQTAVREFMMTAWRVAWMVVIYWLWLNHKG